MLGGSIFGIYPATRETDLPGMGAHISGAFGQQYREAILPGYQRHQHGGWHQRRRRTHANFVQVVIAAMFGKNIRSGRIRIMGRVVPKHLRERRPHAAAARQIVLGVPHALDDMFTFQTDDPCISVISSPGPRTKNMPSLHTPRFPLTESVTTNSASA